MEKLLPFTPHAGQFSLSGSLSLSDGRLRIRYELRDPNQEIVGPLRSGTYEGKGVVRADLLWQHTCFEAFWGEPGAEKYWELNLAPSGQAWNLYRFDSYRKPQPPARSEDFTLERIAIRDGRIDCLLLPQKPLKEIEASLCAVLKTGDAEKSTHYFATAHSGAKADFHLRSSFCLRANGA